MKQFCIGIINAMTAGNHAEASSVSGEKIKIEKNLYVEDLGVPSIRVPCCITNVEVAIAGEVIKILAQQAGLPDGVLNIVTGGGGTGKAVVVSLPKKSPRVRPITSVHRVAG